jgi:predicted AAA+ superfamily ATPase
MVFVDEAQRIPEVGLSLKIILDNFPGLGVVVTGSSSLDLASRVSEPLTGRVYSYRLLPISQGELSAIRTPAEMEADLEERLVFGSYPEVFSLEGAEEKTKYLRNLTDAYLYKDLLEFGDVRNSSKIHDLLKLLAFQVGSQVSLAELAGALELNRGTVDRYIDLLEKSLVIFRLPGFSRNLRKEVTKMDKIYFYDTGVRNAVIGNFNWLKDRDDTGQLWENWLMTERIKKIEYEGLVYGRYYWRLTSGAELDLVEETGGKLAGYEFKTASKKARPPKSWIETYPGAGFAVVNRDNYREFLI